MCLQWDTATLIVSVHFRHSFTRRAHERRLHFLLYDRYDLNSFSNSNKKLSYRRSDIARDADDTDFSVDEPWNGHSRSLKVIRCSANRRGIYDFLLTVNSNLTCIFNRFWDITPSLHMHTPSLIQVDMEKDVWDYGHALASGCAKHWTIES